MSRKSRAKQHSLPPTNTITKSTKKKLNKKKSTPPCVPDSSTSHTKQRNQTKKKKSQSDSQPAPNNPNSKQLSNPKSNSDQLNPLQPPSAKANNTTTNKSKPTSSPQPNEKKPNHSPQTNTHNPIKPKKNKNTNRPPQSSHTNQTPHPSVKENSPNACLDPTAPQQLTRSTCKRNRKRAQYHASTSEQSHQPTPIPVSSTTSSQPNIHNPSKTKKKKKTNKKQRSIVTPPLQTPLPILNPPTFGNSRNPARKQTSLTHSSYTRPQLPSVSPPFRSEICHRVSRATSSHEHLRPRTHRNDNSKTHATQPNTKRMKTVTRPYITSPVPPKYTSHESDTSTQPPVHNSKSPDPSPHLTPSHSCSLQSHPHDAIQPIRTNLTTHPTPHSYAFGGHDIQKGASVGLEHVSIDHHSKMPRYQNQQNREHTWFHVGTHHQQHRSRIQNHNHAGTSLQHGISSLERTHSNTRKRKRNIAGGRYGQDTNTGLPIPMHTSWGPNSQQRNPYIGQLYPIQENGSMRQPFRAHGHQDANGKESSWLQTSAYAQSDPSPHRNVAQHHAYRGGSNRTPSQNRCTPQQPSPFSDAMQMDPPVEQPSNTLNSTQNRAQISNEPSIFPQLGAQSGMRQLDRLKRQIACSANIANGQIRSTGANLRSQRFAGQLTSSTKASRMKLQTRTASPTGEYYGIRCGRDGFSGVATCWKSCSVFVVGYRDAVYDLFDTWEKAERFSDRCGTGASITHRSNCRHFFGGKRNGVMQKGSATQLPWELENDPKVVSLVVGAAWLRFGIGSGIGGYGVFLSLNNPYNCAGLMEGHVTELRLQLKGLLEALEIVYQHRLVKDGGTVELYTTSQEVKNGIDHWLGRWDRSGQWVRDGKPVGSRDLWKAILNIRKELHNEGTRIHTIWIRRPNKVPALRQAVSLARVVFNSDNGRGAEKVV